MVSVSGRGSRLNGVAPAGPRTAGAAYANERELDADVDADAAVGAAAVATGRDDALPIWPMVTPAAPSRPRPRPVLPPRDGMRLADGTATAAAGTAGNGCGVGAATTAAATAVRGVGVVRRGMADGVGTGAGAGAGSGSGSTTRRALLHHTNVHTQTHSQTLIDQWQGQQHQWRRCKWHNFIKRIVCDYMNVVRE